jgi:hypothetical protein
MITHFRLTPFQRQRLPAARASRIDVMEALRAE